MFVNITNISIVNPRFTTSKINNGLR